MRHIHCLTLSLTGLNFMKPLILVAIGLSLSICGFAQTADNSSMPASVKKYKVMTGITSFKCEMKGSTFLMSLRSSDDPGKCIEDARLTAADEFKTAVSSLSGKPRDALKDFHIAHLAYLNALTPNIPEPAREYEARVRNVKAKADEMWTRLEMEIQLGN